MLDDEDFDEDFLDLNEADLGTNLNNPEHPFQLGNLFFFLRAVSFLDAELFELSTEQHDYYSKCFLYLLEKTQVYYRYRKGS